MFIIVMLIFFFPTGSIRSCQKFVIKYHRENLPRLFPQCKTEGEFSFSQIYCESSIFSMLFTNPMSQD